MTTPSTTKTLVLPDRRRKLIDFDSIKLKLASPEEILSWSHGEVIKPETINYQSQKPEMGGLFCQRIFGPIKDWECACGKYKKIRYKGIICDRCGVEVTRSIVRRERMGHIKLVTPVSHIWFLRGVPSKIGLILGMSIQQLEKVIYFANFVITDVKDDLKAETLKQLEEEFKEKKKQLKKESKEEELKSLIQNYNEKKAEIIAIKPKVLFTEAQYRKFSLMYGHFFDASIGAEAILKLLKNTNLSKLIKELEKEKEGTRNPTKKEQIIKRIKFIKNFIVNKIKPEWMILTIIPVIPPDLRPLVQLDGGRFASSDLNDLYRRVINRNNRLKRLYSLNAPEVILRNEKRMLQEAVDALLDNSMRSGKTTIASTGQKRPLKSLADILRGKQGRFRQNLLGKRVDYSGRSVIVVGPHLKLYQCGLPKIMARELFKPLIASKLIKREIVHNVRAANRLIEEGTDVVWEILEEIIKNFYVLLNRAPTLHRLSVQAFQPVLIEGNAIQLHPLVCSAFNADFDGDQMAVHVPISKKSQEEAKNLMLSSHNLLKPANGEPIVNFRLDFVWGAYWMTLTRKNKATKFFSGADETILAYKLKKIGLQEKINVRIDGKIIETSAGRIIFNSILPSGIYKMDKAVDAKILKDIVANIIENESSERAVELLDKIKEMTIYYLTSSGMSWGMDDIIVPEGKKELVKEAEKEVSKIQDQFKKNLLTNDERYSKSIEVWLKTKNDVANLCKNTLPFLNPVITMVESGSRGSWDQMTQMFGMRGIVSSPSGRLIELPIKSSFKEGFNVLEFFISTHGSRKGVSDKALRTSSAGYLTRRMVDVAQDIIVNEEDCGDSDGLRITRQENKELDETWAQRLTGRYTTREIRDPKTKKILVKKDQLITRELADKVNKADPEEVFIRSIFTCKAKHGVCAKCYGYDLAYNKPVKIGTPVGIVAAQSMGEPGTQLTLRTFHTGGVAGKDITQGLPRVEELLEARLPHKQAIIATHSGTVHFIENDSEKKLELSYKSKKEEIYNLDKTWEILVKHGQEVKKGIILAKKHKEKIKANYKGKVKIEEGKLIIIASGIEKEEFDITGYNILVKEGETVKKGQQLTNGSLNLRLFYKLRGKEAVERYILKNVKHVYSSQGQRLNDKHLELIIRQMFSRIKVKDSGDTDLLPGAIVSDFYFQEHNKKAKESGKKLATGERLLLGISKVSLTTDSWLAAASFQQTSRVLINSAITSKPDPLAGLKENVIVGRLIPVGTGFRKRSNTK